MSHIFDLLTGAASTADGADAKVSADSPPTLDAGDLATPRLIKDASQELLKYGLLEASRKPNIYRVVVAHRDSIERLFEPLDLAIKLDEIRGLIYLVVTDAFKEDSSEDEWSHPLVRRQRLSLEQSLLVAILRQQFVAHEQQAGVGSSDAQIALDDLLPTVQLYLGSLGSDAQEQKRLRNLLEQVKGHGIVSEVDAHDQVCIRPIIAHVANPENLHNLLQALREKPTLSSDQVTHDEDAG